VDLGETALEAYPLLKWGGDKQLRSLECKRRVVIGHSFFVQYCLSSLIAMV
jgi:hypothetical protein